MMQIIGVLLAGFGFGWSGALMVYSNSNKFDSIKQKAFYNGCVFGLQIRGYDVFDESITGQCASQAELYSTPMQRSLYRLR